MKKVLLYVFIVVLLITNIFTFTQKVLLERKIENSNALNDVLDDKTVGLIKEITDNIDRDYFYEYDTKELKEGILKGLVNALDDPYSEYMTVEEYKKFNDLADSQYSGVGIIVSPGDDGYLTVVSPIKDGPAFKAGIKPGDKILKVNGEEFTSDTMQDAVSVMKGEAGEKVTLTILRKDENNKIFDVDIVREKIKLNTVEGEIIDETDHIGYIQITEFDRPTYTDFANVFKELKTKNMKNLIIDLRGNPGGLLSVCANIADFFLKDGDIVYTETNTGEKEYFEADSASEDLPLVILVDKGSASASEILSGSLQDRNRAKVVGVQSFGKGIVQRIYDLSDKSALKITISEYFLPSGKSIHKKGVTPDFVIENDKNIKSIGPANLSEDKQLQKAIEVLKGE